MFFNVLFCYQEIQCVISAGKGRFSLRLRRAWSAGCSEGITH